MIIDMKRNRILVLAVLTITLPTLGYVALRSLGVFDPMPLYRPVPPGHQEIVFLLPATSGESWERLVAAVDALYAESQQAGSQHKLQINKDRAFVDLTADVPEVGLWVEGAEDAKLWIRWYKLSSEVDTAHWVSALAERPTPPLAVIGGDVSYRAEKLAKALEEARTAKKWRGPPPLVLFTTATVDRYVRPGIPNTETTNVNLPLLIEIYKGRSFRFSFTNSRMAEVVLDFVRTHDELWPGAPAASNGDPSVTQFYSLKWDDDSFSVDLADRFELVFAKKFPHPHVSGFRIEYSAGDFYQPNPREAFAVGQILPELKADRDQRQLMLLPCNAERARRLLRTLLRRATPPDWKNLVVMTGDSLSFNTIFRDRDVAWNIQDMPVPLVMFSHRNPVAEEVGFKVLSDGSAARGSTGTEDLLLYRDILQALLLAAYQGQRLTPSSEDLLSRFRDLRWEKDRVRLPQSEGNDPAMVLFGPSGNRNDGTGEHIIVLRPDSDDRGIFAQATITVWHVQGDGDPGRFANWQPVRTLQVAYDTLAPGG
jgi:hypothetical protein